MRFLQWLGERDRGLTALRHAGHAAIVMPALFAVGGEVIANAMVATLAAFGSFAMVLLVEFSGPMGDRLKAQLANGVLGGAFVALGTTSRLVDARRQDLVRTDGRAMGTAARMIWTGDYLDALRRTSGSLTEIPDVRTGSVAAS